MHLPPTLLAPNYCVGTPSLFERLKRLGTGSVLECRSGGQSQATCCCWPRGRRTLCLCSPHRVSRSFSLPHTRHSPFRRCARAVLARRVTGYLGRASPFLALLPSRCLGYATRPGLVKRFCSSFCVDTAPPSATDAGPHLELSRRLKTRRRLATTRAAWPTTKHYRLHASSACWSRPSSRPTVSEPYRYLTTIPTTPILPL